MLWLAAAVFAAAAVRDLGWRCIDNRLVVALVLLWAAAVALGDLGSVGVAGHLAVGGVAFVVVLAAYALGWMGGGDVKLAAAVFLWAGPDHAAPVATIIALAGMAVALMGEAARLLTRLALPRPITNGLMILSNERGVPYGVALSLGGVLAVLSFLASGG